MKPSYAERVIEAIKLAELEVERGVDGETYGHQVENCLDGLARAKTAALMMRVSQPAKEE